jgi:hypothetical protein
MSFSLVYGNMMPSLGKAMLYQYQLSCAIMSSTQDMLSSRNYHYTTDSSLVALVLTQIRLRVVPMAQEYQLR